VKNIAVYRHCGITSEWRYFNSTSLYDCRPWRLSFFFLPAASSKSSCRRWFLCDVVARRRAINRKSLSHHVTASHVTCRAAAAWRHCRAPYI